MKKKAKAIFKISAWDEKSYDEFDGGRKLTRANVKKSFRGDIAGESTLEYLMLYREDGSASFIGLERVIGKVGNRSGSFVLEHRGTFENGVAQSTWQIVPDSGTGDLRGLSGEGSGTAGHSEEIAFALDYEFEEVR
jgi:hypothetical protein